MNSDGYEYIAIRRRKYLAHRLAVLYVTGSFPKGLVDHINRDPRDNRIENLREASVSQNGMNSAIRKDNTSGHKGVGWIRRECRWRARGNINGREVSLGRFDRFEDAVTAYERFAKSNHGQFYNSGTSPN